MNEIFRGKFSHNTYNCSTIYMPLVYYSKVTGIAELIGVQLCKQHWHLTPSATGSITAACMAGGPGRSCTGDKQGNKPWTHPLSRPGKNEIFCLTVLGISFPVCVHTPVLPKENLFFPFRAQLYYHNVWGRQELLGRTKDGSYGADWVPNCCKPPENYQWGFLQGVCPNQ